MNKAEHAKDAIRSFIDKRVEQLFLKPYVAKVLSKTNDDMEIEIFGLRGENSSEIFKWSDGIFYRLDNFWIEEDDYVFIHPIDNTFVITGRITKSFPKLIDIIDASSVSLPHTIFSDLEDDTFIRIEVAYQYGSGYESDTLSFRFGDLPSAGIYSTAFAEHRTTVEDHDHSVPHPHSDEGDHYHDADIWQSLLFQKSGKELRLTARTLKGSANMRCYLDGYYNQ